MFSELNHPEDKLQLGGGWGWEQEMLFQKLQKGLFWKKKIKRVSGEFLACLETARLIAMRFRFETGSRQHLENDSLEELTKKLWFAPSQVYVFVPFTVSFVVLEGSPAPSLRPPPAFGASGQSLTPPITPSGRGGLGEAELFLELAGERVKGILLLQGEKVP